METSRGRISGAFYTRSVSVTERIKSDTTSALKAGDRERAQALRLITAELQRAVKDASGADETAVLQRERKRRLEAADAFTNGGRDDLAATERREAELIEEYLPEQISDEDLKALVADTLAESGAESIKDMGRVMAIVMGKVEGRADGRRVSAAVKGRLA